MNYEEGMKRISDIVKKIEEELRREGRKSNPIKLNTGLEFDHIVLECFDWEDPDSPFIIVEINGHKVCIDENGCPHSHKDIRTRPATEKEKEWYKTGKYTIRNGEWCKFFNCCGVPYPFTDIFWELKDGEPKRSYCKDCNREMNRIDVHNHRVQKKQVEKLKRRQEAEMNW